MGKYEYIPPTDSKYRGQIRKFFYEYRNLHEHEPVKNNPVIYKQVYHCIKWCGYINYNELMDIVDWLCDCDEMDFELMSDSYNID